jgi:3-hydroxyisobutyrate dehydrogenase-like beta-hydroxyacid dehydrogenase
VTDPAVTVAVLGVGEAGSEIVADLLAAGATVRVHDPAVPAPDSAVSCADEAEAARGADVVLSVNSAASARDALSAGLDGCTPSTVWADLNTASPALEEELAELAGKVEVPFADVSLMSPVPGKGLGTPMLASGDGAARFAELLGPLGAPVEVLESPAGEASRRKLLRSVFFKGMAAAVVEALEASAVLGLDGWMRAVIATELEQADAAFASRLETGSIRHAVRRTEEMAAATEMLTALGVPPRVASASHDWLLDLQRYDVARIGNPGRADTGGDR